MKERSLSSHLSTLIHRAHPQAVLLDQALPKPLLEPLQLAVSLDTGHWQKGVSSAKTVQSYGMGGWGPGLEVANSEPGSVHYSRIRTNWAWGAAVTEGLKPLKPMRGNHQREKERETKRFTSQGQGLEVILCRKSQDRKRGHYVRGGAVAIWLILDLSYKNLTSCEGWVLAPKSLETMNSSYSAHQAFSFKIPGSLCPGGQTGCNHGQLCQNKHPLSGTTLMTPRTHSWRSLSWTSSFSYSMGSCWLQLL